MCRFVEYILKGLAIYKFLRIFCGNFKEVLKTSGISSGNCIQDIPTIDFL